MSTIDDSHVSLVARRLADGAVVPFLGAGANLCDRPRQTTPWKPGRYAPSGRELARALADECGYPAPDDPDLLWVSQYFDAVLGDEPLYDKLHDVFDSDYPPTELHRLLARVPALLRERGREQLLVLTTNYDDLVERALEEAGEEFDTVWYEAKEVPEQGRFWHRLPDGEVVPVKLPNKYTGLALAKRPVILKLHGAIDRLDRERDSYVLTEDSYIDYLAGPSVGDQIPFSLMAKMKTSHFLFLGYSMRDWNMRVILKRLWRGDTLGHVSWAVQLPPSGDGAQEVERKLWSRRGNIELHYAPLKEYVKRLGAELPVPSRV